MIFNFPDSILLKQISLRQDHAAFLRLYDLHTETLCLLALQLTAGDKLAAGTIIQNTWIATVEHGLKYSEKRSFRNRLVSMVVDGSREYYHKKHQYMLIDNNFNQLLASMLTKYKTKIVWLGPEDALGLLPVGYRHVVVLHDLYYYRQAEISNLLGMSEGSVMNHLFKARKALRQLMGTNYSSHACEYSEWSNAQLKTFRSAFSNIYLHKELKTQVVNQLDNMGLVLKSSIRHFQWSGVLNLFF